MVEHGGKEPEARNLLFHPGHTWVDLVSLSEVRVGISDLVLRLVGPPDKLVLPEQGDTLRSGERAVGLRQGSRVINLLTPVSGEVSAINREVLSGDREASRPKGPLGGQWVLTIRPDRLGLDLKAMRAGREAASWMADQERKASRFFRDWLGPLHDRDLGFHLGDGGLLAEGILSKMDDYVWQSFCREFLKSYALIIR